MKASVLFLAGRYYSSDFSFYRKLARGKYTVAVDGGFRFFKRAGLTPDLLIGDLDSLGGKPRQLSTKTKLIVHPTAKDQTDTELALRHCVKQGARSIDIVQPAIGDPDHFLANLYLLTLKLSGKTTRQIKLRLVGPRFEAIYLDNSRHVLRQAVGETVSVIPVSASIRLTGTGMEYDSDWTLIKRGQTKSARNRVVSLRAAIEVSGQAFLIRLLGRK